MDSFGYNRVAEMPADAGVSAAGHEVFALTDEQILEIEPEGTSGDSSARNASMNGVPDRSDVGTAANAAVSGDAPVSASANGGAVAPAWLAELINDPSRGAEAREFWNKAEQARVEAAAFREVFADAGAAKTAAERARSLEEIDRAYFAGDAGERSRLATSMLREDPAAFREMVFAGLRALEEVERVGGRATDSATDSRLAAAFRRSGEVARPAAESGATAGVTHGAAPHAERVAAYAAFEKSANEELERSVGGVIERTLEQALPSAGHGENGALKRRLVGAIRADVEKALQGDRQLGEQVARVLSGKQLGSEARGQVVRLIAARAEQLVPGAAKRVVGEWTQTTMAAHRERNERAAVGVFRQDVATAATSSGSVSGRDAESAGRRVERRGVNYRNMTDDQILGM
jgi:hypothetical protein